MSIKAFGLTVLLPVAYFMMPSQPLTQKTHKVTRLKHSFEMRAWPSHVVVHHNQSIPIQIALRNMTNRDAYIRLWFWPVPFGPHTDLHCLMLRCRNQITGREVRYMWPPAGMAVADAQGKEFPDKIPPGKYTRNILDMRQFCVLPPGKYILELQYDTRFTPSWIKPDKRAWHGITNRVMIKIKVLK